MEKKYSVGKSIVKTTLITALTALVAIVFVALGFYVINPKLSAQICSNLGLKNFEVSCYELVYARSKDDGDLYNLIVKLGNVNKPQKQTEYINKLQKSERYDTFCENLDNSIVETYKNNQISAKNLVSLYGINEFITYTEIINYVKCGNLDKAYELALASKNTDKDYEISMFYYFDYLMTNDISAEQKTYYSTMIKTEALEYLEFKDSTISFSNAAEQILYSYAKVKIKYSKYVLYKLTNDANENSAKTEWQTAVNEYNNLVR